jgi:RNA polymerase sigma-70 factor, ECF subfamily
MKHFSKYDDKQLIALIAEDSPHSNEAFNILYSRYSDSLHSYCIYNTDNVEDAEDIFQEVWLKFHRTVKSGNCDFTLPVYLYIMVKNLIIDKYKSKATKLSSMSEFSNLDDIPDLFNLQNNIEHDELINLINTALNYLPENQKEAFVLKWFSGLTNPEISKVTGETLDKIKYRSNRAMDKVISILKPIINEINTKVKK